MVNRDYTMGLSGLREIRNKNCVRFAVASESWRVILTSRETTKKKQKKTNKQTNKNHRMSYFLTCYTKSSWYGFSVECEMPAKPVQSWVTAYSHRAAERAAWSSPTFSAVTVKCINVSCRHIETDEKETNNTPCKAHTKIKLKKKGGG